MHNQNHQHFSYKKGQPLENFPNQRFLTRPAIDLLVAGHIMADFADNDIQKLLQQAEQRLSGGRVVAEEASTASAAAKPVGEDVVQAAAPTPELAQVRVPQPKMDAQRKGKVSKKKNNNNIPTLSLSLFSFPSILHCFFQKEIAGIKMKVSRKAQ